MHYNELFKLINELEPLVSEQIEIDEVYVLLLIQVKGSDVHPNQRHPDFFFGPNDIEVKNGSKKIGTMKNKKTQIDVTAPMHLDDNTSPATALFTPGNIKYHPVRILHPQKKKWEDTTIRIQPHVQIAQGPAKDQARLLLGGSTLNSWSSELWANMGHYEKDRNAFIFFVRSRKNTKPISFSLPRHTLLEETLIEYGRSKKRWEWPTGRFSHMDDTPKTKAVVIPGPAKPKQEFTLEYLYVVTNPDKKGWVKIGKTKREPRFRLSGYQQGPVIYDMNLIIPTSNCDEAEKEIIRRLDQTAVPKEGNEWYKLGSLDVATSTICAVAELYPPPLNLTYEPIINSVDSWAIS